MTERKGESYPRVLHVKGTPTQEDIQKVREMLEERKREREKAPAQ